MPGSKLTSYLERATALRSSQKGTMVSEFEEAFAKYVGAKHAISHCNGTSTMHTALVALGVKPGDRVIVPPLTYASTSLAVIHAGATPIYGDIEPDTWNLRSTHTTWNQHTLAAGGFAAAIPVSLYGLWSGWESAGAPIIDDAAETLNPHRDVAFTSYSFEASKILPIGEGGMLVTNDDTLAWKARQFRCVGYHKGGPEDEFVFTPSRSPNAIRHDVIGWNYLMSDVQAAVGLARLEDVEEYVERRQYSAECYRQALHDFPQCVPQRVPEGFAQSYWVYGVALPRTLSWQELAKTLQKLGGEIPRGAFRLTYQEPAFSQYAPNGTCPVAEDLQPRLIQLATNHTHNQSEHAADCLHRALAICD